MIKILGFLRKLIIVFSGIVGTLFSIYIFNMDMKIAAVGYRILNKYHDQKVTDVRF